MLDAPIIMDVVFTVILVGLAVFVVIDVVGWFRRRRAA